MTLAISDNYTITNTITNVDLDTGVSILRLVELQLESSFTRLHKEKDRISEEICKQIGYKIPLYLSELLVRIDMFSNDYRITHFPDATTILRISDHVHCDLSTPHTLSEIAAMLTDDNVEKAFIISFIKQRLYPSPSTKIDLGK